MNIPKYLAASGLFLGLIAPALPDTNVGSPRSIAVAAGMALVAVAVYLGAPQPQKAVKHEPGS